MTRGIHGACGCNGHNHESKYGRHKTDANNDALPLHQSQRKQTIAVLGATWPSGTGKLMVIAGTDRLV